MAIRLDDTRYQITDSMCVVVDTDAEYVEDARKKFTSALAEQFLDMLEIELRELSEYKKGDEGWQAHFSELSRHVGFVKLNLAFDNRTGYEKRKEVEEQPS